MPFSLLWVPFSSIMDLITWTTIPFLPCLQISFFGKWEQTIPFLLVQNLLLFIFYFLYFCFIFFFYHYFDQRNYIFCIGITHLRGKIVIPIQRNCYSQKLLFLSLFWSKKLLFIVLSQSMINIVSCDTPKFKGNNLLEK